MDPTSVGKRRGGMAMKKRGQQTVGALGERAIIERLIRILSAGCPRGSGGSGRAHGVVGPGDDCAVVRPADDACYDYLLKSDPVIEGVHFTHSTPGVSVGHKALARVLSDIAAMGGVPLWALVNLVAPPATAFTRIAGLYTGLNRLARRWRVAIVGGDVSCGPRLEAHVFGVGRVPHGQAILRSGACPGDYLFVTGTLGGSCHGKHLTFQPRLAEGNWLQRRQWATAMIDLSDGLATDLRHLVRQSRVGARLFLESIPLAPAAGKSAARRHALGDGEDYELLFTVAPANTAKMTRAWRRKFKIACTCIGRITGCRGVIECVDARQRKMRMQAVGHEHFR